MDGRLFEIIGLIRILRIVMRRYSFRYFLFNGLFMMDTTVFRRVIVLVSIVER